jgi:hypothetical protein
LTHFGALLQADDIVCDNNSTAVLVANNGEQGEIKCLCCAELELELVKTRIELQRTLGELSSAQVIIQMLKEEHTQKDEAISLTQQTEDDLIGVNGWTEVKPKDPKKSSKHELESRNTNEPIKINNYYEALDLESTSLGRNYGKSTNENKLNVKNNNLQNPKLKSY